ncbi:uncharacterized [Tachysurus ichikawai]
MAQTHSPSLCQCPIRFHSPQPDLGGGERRKKKTTIERKAKSESEKSGGGSAAVSGPCYADHPDTWRPLVTVTIERLTHGQPSAACYSCLLHDVQPTNNKHKSTGCEMIRKSQLQDPVCTCGHVASCVLQHEEQLISVTHSVLQLSTQA